MSRYARYSRDSYVSYIVPDNLMVAITSTESHKADAKEKLHLILIGIHIPYDTLVEIHPPGKGIIRSKGDEHTYYIRVNPSYIWSQSITP